MSERFEPTDLPAGLLARLGGWLALAVFATFLVMYGFLHLMRSASPRAQEAAVQPPLPRLQPNPTLDLATLRARDATALTRYRWIDRKQRVIAMPIERAMDLIIERGLPTRPQP